MIDRAALRRAAEDLVEYAPGPWEHDEDKTPNVVNERINGSPYEIANTRDSSHGSTVRECLAKHIAAANPAAILELLGELERAEDLAEINTGQALLAVKKYEEAVRDGNVMREQWDAAKAERDAAKAILVEKRSLEWADQAIAFDLAAARADKAEAERDHNQERLDACIVTRDALKADLAACRHDYSAEKIWRETAQADCARLREELATCRERALEEAAQVADVFGCNSDDGRADDIAAAIRALKSGGGKTP